MFNFGDLGDIVRSAGYLILLALAAQAVLEVIKAGLNIRGEIVANGALHAVRLAAKQTDSIPDEMAEAVRQMLIAMGLGGFRRGALKVDHLTPDQLKGLVETIDPSTVPSLSAVAPSDATAKLRSIADRCQAFYALVQGSFEAKYNRRLRGWMLVASAVVVFAADADIFSLMASTARPSSMAILADSVAKDGLLLGLRIANAKAVVGALDSLIGEAQASRASAARVDTLSRRKRALEDSVAVFGALLSDSIVQSRLGWSDRSRGLHRLRNPRWWLGILASILLVSLGPKAYQAVYGGKE